MSSDDEKRELLAREQKAKQEGDKSTHQEVILEQQKQGIDQRRFRFQADDEDE
jgi:hypothetical protein